MRGVEVAGVGSVYRMADIERSAKCEVRSAIMSWFNHHRLLGPIGYIPPAEAEANYHRQLASQSSMVAV